MVIEVLAVGVERSIRFLAIATHDSLHPATVQPPCHGPGIPLAIRQDPANEQIAIHLQNQVVDRGLGGR